MLGSRTDASAYAKANKHPDVPDKTIWEVFEEERPNLVPYVGPFDGFHAVPASVSQNLSRAVRQEPLLGRRPRGWPARRDPRLCRPSGNAGRMDGSWDAMIAPLSAARRSMTRSTTSRFWRANLAPCATGRRSRSGTCLRPCAGFSESSNDSPAATAKWSISSAPCSPMAWMRSKPPVQRPCLTTFIPPASC